MAIDFDEASCTQVLEQAVQQGVFPGAVVLAADQGEVVYLHSCGNAQLQPTSRPATTDTFYDLASLTKCLVTTTIAMRLSESGQLDLRAPVQDLLPLFAHSRPRVQDLLSHSSGLPAHRPYWQAPHPTGHAAFFARALGEPLEYPPGTKAVYSDVGFLALGCLLEQMGGARLDVLFRPFGSDALRFGPVDDAAATEKQPDGNFLTGVVHDENARAMGGVAPHAGLFGTALGIHDFLRGLVSDRWITQKTRDLFWSRSDVPGSTWCLGWDSPSILGYSAAGTRLPRTAVGHLGFTGCSLWMDPKRPFWLILLSNRIHPSRSNDRIRAFRPVLADAICAASGLYGPRAL